MVGGFIDNGASDAPALRTASAVVTYGELRRRISERRQALQLPDRSIVVVVATSTTEFVVTYLALLAEGHVPLLAGPQHERLVECWRPAAVIDTGGAGWTIDRRPTAATGAAGEQSPVPHPDLGLLLSTSGTSGGPKLVRLSNANLVENASSIVDYLGLGPDDVAITTLPLNYCFGLSVLHSHLLAGASIVLTDASVVDPGFVPLLEQHGVTNIAGVPHTFELLERSAAASVLVPSLRFLAQAGGRMAPDRVRAWLDRCEAHNASLFVMYGQTEATARMAYVPPSRLREHPSTIGVPIPGGDLEVRVTDDGGTDRPAADGEVGELVYRGPNVMMGYAEQPIDLAAGAMLTELRTGDLGRRLENGLFEVVGRRSRFVKPFGLRIDLDDLERRIAADEASGLSDAVLVTGDDGGVVVGAVTEGVAGEVDLFRAAGAARLLTLTARLTSLPPSMIDVVVLDRIPRSDRGKIDRATVLRASRTPAAATAAGSAGTHGAPQMRSLQAARRASPAKGAAPRPSGPAALPDANSVASVRALYCKMLGVSDVGPNDTFVTLGGDSLSYVECSIRLEDLLGELPADWHLRPVGSFGAPVERTWSKSVDTTVVLRAVAILTVVTGHMILTPEMGGAHLMLAIAGYNISRFMLGIEPVSRRWRAVARAMARIAVPTMAWVAAGMVFFDYYSWQTLLLVNDFFGPAEHLDEQWNFWFIEVLVQLTVLLMAGLSIPILRTWERRWPYGFVFVLTVLSVAFRIEQLQFGGWYNTIYRPHGAAMVFLLGWLVHRSWTPMLRAATTVLTIVALAGYFREPRRDVFVIAFLVLLVWRRDVRIPRVVVRPIAVLAAASMSIYITHYTVYPAAQDHLDPWPAFFATVASGVMVWWAASRISRWVTRARSNQLATSGPSVDAGELGRSDELVGRSTMPGPVG